MFVTPTVCLKVNQTLLGLALGALGHLLDCGGKHQVKKVPHVGGWSLPSSHSDSIVQRVCFRGHGLASCLQSWSKAGCWGLQLSKLPATQPLERNSPGLISARGGAFTTAAVQVSCARLAVLICSAILQPCTQARSQAIWICIVLGMEISSMCVLACVCLWVRTHSNTAHNVPMLQNR